VLSLRHEVSLRSFGIEGLGVVSFVDCSRIQRDAKPPCPRTHIVRYKHVPCNRFAIQELEHTKTNIYYQLQLPSRSDLMQNPPLLFVTSPSSDRDMLTSGRLYSPPVDSHTTILDATSPFASEIHIIDNRELTYIRYRCS